MFIHLNKRMKFLVCVRLFIKQADIKELMSRRTVHEPFAELPIRLRSLLNLNGVIYVKIYLYNNFIDASCSIIVGKSNIYSFFFFNNDIIKTKLEHYNKMLGPNENQTKLPTQQNNYGNIYSFFQLVCE